MSLILEALKKSEARRRLGEAPGLGTPFTVTRRRRSALPVILILIVAAGAFGWYYLGSGPAVPPKTTSPPPSPQSPNVPANGTFVTAKPSSNPIAGAAKPITVMPPRPVTGQVARATPVPPTARNAGTPAVDTNALRTPHPATPANPPSVVASGEGAVKPELPETPQPAAASPKPAMATAPPPPRATAVPQPAPPPPAPPPASSPAAPPVAQPAATSSPSAAAAPAAPPVPLYYELPYNVRKDLPALNVTMHVFAATPAQRFILIDGERKSEGDSLKDGLTVREIRNDGVIMEFRGQQFFYPRPGR